MKTDMALKAIPFKTYGVGLAITKKGISKKKRVFFEIMSVLMRHFIFEIKHNRSCTVNNIPKIRGNDHLETQALFQNQSPIQSANRNSIQFFRLRKIQENSINIHTQTINSFE